MTQHPPKLSPGQTAADAFDQAIAAKATGPARTTLPTSAYSLAREIAAAEAEAFNAATAASSAASRNFVDAASSASAAHLAAGSATAAAGTAYSTGITAASATLAAGSAQARLASPSAPGYILRILETPADLGGLVRQAREGMDLTQAEFAEMAGVGRRFLSELENGKATLELGKVMTVCAAAGLDLLAGPA